MAELSGLVTQHGLGSPHLHASLPQPADQAGQLAVALEGVVAQVAAGEGGGERGRWGEEVDTSVECSCKAVSIIIT